MESWKEDDDPYHVHAIRSNSCGFIRSKLIKSEIRSILYHYYKTGIMETVNQAFRRHVLETILENQSGSQDETVVKLCILGNLDNRPGLVKLMQIFTVTDIVNEVFHMHPTDDDDDVYRNVKLCNTTRDELMTLLVQRRNGVHRSCECPESRRMLEFDEPNESGTQLKLPYLNSDARPPSILKFLSAHMPEPEPAKILPYEQLPCIGRSTVFSNELYKLYTREQAVRLLEILMNSYACTMCKSEPSSVVYVPCKHMVTCDSCNMTDPCVVCPVCDIKISTSISVRLCDTQMLGWHN